MQSVLALLVDPARAISVNTDIDPARAISVNTDDLISSGLLNSPTAESVRLTVEYGMSAKV